MTELKSNTGPSEPGKSWRRCETCGNPFEAQTVLLAGREIAGARNCPLCTKEYFDAVKQRSAPAPKLDRSAAWAAICPPLFRLTTEDGQTEIGKLVKKCPLLHDIENYKYGRRGLVLQGPTGLCKTRAMWRLIRRLFDEGKSIAAMSSDRFGRHYAEAAGKFESQTWIDHVSSVDALYVDDLGKGNWSDAVRGAFFEVFDIRMNNLRPIYITTNEDSDTLADKMKSGNLADPLLRRLGECCKIMKL